MLGFVQCNAYFICKHTEAFKFIFSFDHALFIHFQINVIKGYENCFITAYHHDWVSICIIKDIILQIIAINSKFLLPCHNLTSNSSTQGWWSRFFIFFCFFFFYCWWISSNFFTLKESTTSNSDSNSASSPTNCKSASNSSANNDSGFSFREEGDDKQE